MQCIFSGKNLTNNGRIILRKFMTSQTAKRDDIYASIINRNKILNSLGRLIKSVSNTALFTRLSLPTFGN
jgi:2,4-dienoyl-CoA reductase-like NADH-dependent reductase (Old Yellow Enzyme family)